jgi:hypothetical protein
MENINSQPVVPSPLSASFNSSSRNATAIKSSALFPSAIAYFTSDIV